MNVKDKNYTRVIEKTLTETKIDQVIRIVDGDKRTIRSFLGVFNTDVAIDILKCLILNCVSKFKEDNLKEISRGYLLKTLAKQRLVTLEKELNALLQRFNCNTSETLPKMMTTDEFQDLFTSTDWQGIDVVDLETKVKILGTTIRGYVADVENHIDLVKFEKGRSSVFELNSTVSDDMLIKLYRILIDYKADYGKEIMICTESDFLEVLRGRGNSIRKIKIINQAALNTLVKFFEVRGWFVGSNHTAFWDYLAGHFCSLDGKSWVKKYLSSNKNRSENAEIKHVFEIFDRNNMN